MIRLRPQLAETTNAPEPLTDVGRSVGHQLDPSLDSSQIDSALVTSLRRDGVTRHRVVVRWNEIIVGPSGDVDRTALETLGDSIDLLLDAGIEPLVALDNLAVPEFLVADGGWLNLATARAYGNFAGVLGARLGDRVDEWLALATIPLAPHEPSMLDPLASAQADAQRILRAHCPLATIGVSLDASQLDIEEDAA